MIALDLETELARMIAERLARIGPAQQGSGMTRANAIHGSHLLSPGGVLVAYSHRHGCHRWLDREGRWCNRTDDLVQYRLGYTLPE